jgi:hypothetical protein
MMKTIILTAIMATEISQSAFFVGIPIKSEPCNATAESIKITEWLILDELEAVKNGMWYQYAWAKANNAIFDSVLMGKQKNTDIMTFLISLVMRFFNISICNLRSKYYKMQCNRDYNLIYNLIDNVKNGKPYNEALDEAHTRIYKSIDLSFIPNMDLAVDKVYLYIPATDIVMFAAGRKYLFEAIS